MTLPLTDRSQTLSADHVDVVSLDVQFPGRPLQRLLLDQPEFLVGRGEFCDLLLNSADAPQVLCELHTQKGSVWIEAADDRLPLEINGRMYTRLALRNGDHIRLSGVDLIVRIGSPAELPVIAPAQPEDLSDLSADELCDRIIAEQLAVDEFETGRMKGWKDLLDAIESTLVESQATVRDSTDQRIDIAIQELRELSQVLAEQTRQLAQQEEEMIEVGEELRTSQESITRKLDQLLQHFGDSELRASA